jgi:hypothetical protein
VSLWAMRELRRIEQAMIPYILFKKRIDALGKEVAQFIKKDAKNAVPWNPKMKWREWMMISADSYNRWLGSRNLAPELRPTENQVRKNMTPSEYISIPGTDMHYLNAILPKHTRLYTACGNRIGWVAFDGDVVIPSLRRGDGGRDKTWMSLTPMEIMTLRPGVTKARKHTVIAGLGLGHQLIDVTRKRTVKTVTLVERSKPLRNWVLPRIERHLGDAKLYTLCGDARKILPGLTADVALTDIDDSYGNNEFHPETPNIPVRWVWGSAVI